MSESTGQMVKQLVESAKEGDRSAFDVLFALSKTKLIVFISRHFYLEREEAEDIVAETFGKAWGSIAQFRGDCAFSSWLVTIATNLARNRAGRAYLSRELSYDSPIQEEEGEVQREFLDEQTSLVDLDVQAAEMQELVQDAIARLRPEFKEVIVLRDFEGLSYKEIATQLNVTEPALRARLHRARQALKNLLERDDYFLEYSQTFSRRERDAERRRLLDRIESHRRDIKGFVMRLIGDGSRVGMTADDMVQEVLIRVWSNIDRYEEQGQLLAWLLAITRNTVINFVRKGQRTVEALVGTVSTEDPEDLRATNVADQGRPFDDLLAGEEVADEMLAGLPAEFREACRLSDVNDLSYKEVAESLQIPLGTVRSRLFRGRKMLQQRLARREENDLALRPFEGKAVDHEAKFSSFAKQVKDHIGTLAADRGYVGLDINALWQQTCRHIVAGLDAATSLKPAQTLSLLKLAATHVVDIEGKKAKLLGDIPLGQDESVVVIGSGSFDDQVIQLPNAQALLDALPEDIGPAYGLKVWCGLSHKKIATTLGIEPNTVRGRLAKARELLTEALSKEADQLGAAVNITLEGGEALSKVKGGGPAIIGSQLAREAGSLPLGAIGDETLYQNLARTCVAGTDRDLVAFMDRFGATDLEMMIKRFCFHPRKPAELERMTKIDPGCLVREIPGSAWLKIELGDIVVYELEERLSREGEESHKTLEQLYHLLGCADGTDFAGRLDYDKIPSSSQEGKGHTEKQGQTLVGEGSAETPMAPPRTNGGRPASELGDLIATLSEKPEPDMTLKDFEMGLTGPDRKKLYDALNFGDVDDFDEWADKDYDPKWKPAYLAAAKGSSTVPPAQAAAQSSEAVELVQTGPFTDIVEFAGKNLSEAEMNRLAETPVSLWGIESDVTFAQLALRMYRKGEEKDGRGLVTLGQLVEHSQLKGRLPMNADSNELFRLAIAERTRQRKEAQAGNGSGTAGSGSQTTTSRLPATGTSGNATPAATGGNNAPASAGSQATKEVLTMGRFSWKTTSADKMPEAHADEMLDKYTVRIWDEASGLDPEEALKVRQALYDGLRANYADIGLPEYNSLSVAVGRMRRSASGNAGAVPKKAAPKKAAPKKAAPKKAAPKTGPMNEEEQQEFWQLPPANHIDLVEGDGWPAIDDGVVLKDYLSSVKSAGVDAEDVFRVVDGIAGGRLPRDVFDAFYAQLGLASVSQPAAAPAAASPAAAAPAPTPAPTPIPRSAPMAEGIVVAAHLDRPMTELELALAEFVVQSGLVNEDDLLFQFLRQRQDVLADLSRYMIEKVAASAPEASEEAIAVLGRRLEQFMRDFILPAKAVAEAESA